jgi:hypothetical protein
MLPRTIVNRSTSQTAISSTASMTVGLAVPTTSRNRVSYFAINLPLISSSLISSRSHTSLFRKQQGCPHRLRTPRRGALSSSQFLLGHPSTPFSPACTVSLPQTSLPPFPRPCRLTPSDPSRIAPPSLVLPPHPALPVLSPRPPRSHSHRLPRPLTHP